MLSFEKTARPWVLRTAKSQGCVSAPTELIGLLNKHISSVTSPARVPCAAERGKSRQIALATFPGSVLVTTGKLPEGVEKALDQEPRTVGVSPAELAGPLGTWR